MKKRTKIISTAIALVLVMGFMVVGILAATASTANITAQVSWTATAGLEFEVYAGTLYSSEHNEVLKQKNQDYFKNLVELDGYVNANGGDMIPFETTSIQYNEFGQPTKFFEVDTTTTNTSATGMSASLNATFIDDSDDGVNNPRDIIYYYTVVNKEGLGIHGDEFQYTTKSLVINFTALPQSNDNIKVYYGLDEDSIIKTSYSSLLALTASTVKPTSMTIPKNYPLYYKPSVTLMIRLHIENPDVNIENFKADVGFAFSYGE